MTSVSCAKTTEPIEMLFGMWTRGAKEPCIGPSKCTGPADPPKGMDTLGAIGLLGHPRLDGSRYSQPYTLWGISNAASNY